MTFCVVWLQVMLAVVKAPPWPGQIGAPVLDTVVKLMSSCQDSVPPNLVVKLTSAAFSGTLHFSHVQDFVKATMDMPFFEKVHIMLT